eukprot:scaffold107732_cov69-Phaeocystis_antarctica.AAC.1
MEGDADAATSVPPPRVAFMSADDGRLTMVLVAKDAAQASLMVATVTEGGEGGGFAMRLTDRYAKEGGTLDGLSVGAANAFTSQRVVAPPPPSSKPAPPPAPPPSLPSPPVTPLPPSCP